MAPLEEEDDEYHGDTIVVKGENYPLWPHVSSPSMSPEIDDTREVPAAIPGPQTRSFLTPKSRFSTAANTTMEDRLKAMPAKRPLPWREGVESGAEKETGGDSRRKQIRFGLLLATRGEVQESPCASCANGRGKFTVCVALEGYFKGACASCQLSGRPNRCSIKKNDEDAETPTILANYHVEHDEPHSPNEVPSVPEAKRRRKETDLAEQVPEWEKVRPQWERELGDSQARQQMNEIGQRPWAPANDDMGMNGINVIRTIPPEQRNSMGWAAVNQPPAPPIIPQAYGAVPDRSSAGFRPNNDQGRREDTAFMNDEGGIALIDTLPKSKQRQVYGLVSGLQNGIQGLQRELDSLKKALGIDED